MNRIKPDRADIAQFAIALFKHADPGTYASLRRFPQTAGKGSPLIDAVELTGDPAKLSKAAYRQACRAAEDDISRVFCPPIAVPIVGGALMHFVPWLRLIYNAAVTLASAFVAFVVGIHERTAARWRTSANCAP